MSISINTMGKKRIILLMQFYDPEPAYKGQDFAEAIAQAGYEVEVVTGFPNYPGGNVYNGYRIRPIQRSHQNGIEITRLALYPSHNTSKLGRVINYTSFAVSAFIYLAFFARRANLVYVYSPPATVGLAAVSSGFFRRFPVLLDIHDLWPDTLPATGMLTNGRLLRIVDQACCWMYRQAQHIVLHTNGFRERLLERGVPAEKMTTIIGWTKEIIGNKLTYPSISAISNLKGLKILYAGNIGPAQALESVLEAARLLKEAGESDLATFCFLGSGLARDALMAEAERLCLDNVTFLPRVPLEEVGAYLSGADALLVHLRDDPLFAITLPSKTQAYMLAGRPIIMAVRGEAAELIEAAQGGIAISPENPKAMVDAVRMLAFMTPDERKKMGQNAQYYYDQHLSMEKGIHKFIDVIGKLVSRDSQ